MKPVRFALVGGGWRAAFYLRIAEALPERFAVMGMVVRDPNKGRALEGKWNVPTYRTVGELLGADSAQFAVTCVPWEANPLLIRELVGRGVAVLSETPPASDVQGLREMWSLVAQGARIQVAEQYIYQPHHAVRLAFVASGALGAVSQAQVSAAHGYHGISLIRHYLGIGYENARITAYAFTSPLVAGPGRIGPPLKERIAASTQTIARLDFGDRLGVYDFAGDQYFSWIRNERLLVRGERGEIIGQEASYLCNFDEPIEIAFKRQVAGANGNLEGLYLKGILAGERWLYRNPFVPARLADDEIAVATSLQGLADYLQGGHEVYSLAEACQDRYLDILISQAVESGQVVESERQAWAEAG